jgi:hypothetical protein
MSEATVAQVAAEEAVAESPDAKRAAEKRRAAAGLDKPEPEARAEAPKGRRSKPTDKA